MFFSGVPGNFYEGERIGQNPARLRKPVRKYHINSQRDSIALEMRFLTIGKRNPSATINNKEVSIMWIKPAYEDLRIGFEVTMYFANH